MHGHSIVTPRAGVDRAPTYYQPTTSRARGTVGAREWLDPRTLLVGIVGRCRLRRRRRTRGRRGSGERAARPAAGGDGADAGGNRRRSGVPASRARYEERGRSRQHGARDKRGERGGELAPDRVRSTAETVHAVIGAGRATRNRTGCRSRALRGRWVPYPSTASSARAAPAARTRPQHGTGARQASKWAADRRGAVVIVGADGADGEHGAGVLAFSGRHDCDGRGRGGVAGGRSVARQGRAAGRSSGGGGGGRTGRGHRGRAGGRGEGGGSGRDAWDAGAAASWDRASSQIDAIAISITSVRDLAAFITAEASRAFGRSKSLS